MAIAQLGFILKVTRAEIPLAIIAKGGVVV